jgi:hypothetical protein
MQQRLKSRHLFSASQKTKCRFVIFQGVPSNATRPLGLERRKRFQTVMLPIHLIGPATSNAMSIKNVLLTGTPGCAKLPSGVSFNPLHVFHPLLTHGTSIETRCR